MREASVRCFAYDEGFDSSRTESDSVPQKRRVILMEDKIGVFICTGYGIAEALDIDALVKVANDEYKVPFCRTVGCISFRCWNR